jgi:hypothetical protein
MCTLQGSRYYFFKIAHVEKLFFSLNLGVTTDQNYIHDEIKNDSGNASYHSLQNLLSMEHILLPACWSVM